MTNRVTIVEVGPRDGLQNEAARISAADKVAFVERLAAAGLPVIEVTSFVRPDRVPQLADAREVFAALASSGDGEAGAASAGAGGEAGASRRGADTRYTALVPNLTGLREALAAGVREVAIFAAASEGFSQRNTNRSIAESLTAFVDVCREAQAAGVRVRGYLSTAFGCPFDGAVDPRRVGEIARRLRDLGVYEVAISDTIGIAHPGQVRPVVEATLSAGLDISEVALHFHDTRGQALANVMAALPLGVRTFDASAGGLGGCPFAPGATGNLATEDLVYLLDGLGYETGVSLPGVIDASAFIEPLVGHPLPSRVYRASR
ncbi:MAG: hydroxymethylglutaryl-CoA lyase [Vicinamibacteraceae bacterium]